MLAPESKLKIDRLHADEGWGARRIAATLGLPYGQVRLYMAKVGLRAGEAPPGGPPTRDTKWRPGLEFDVDSGTGTLRVNVPFGQTADPKAAFTEMLGHDPPIPVPLERLTFTVTGFRAWQGPNRDGVPVWYQHWTYRVSDGLDPVDSLVAKLATVNDPVEWVALPRLKPGSAPKLFVVMGDDQAPHHNRPLHEAACEMMSDCSPDGFVYVGDGADLDSLRPADKDHPSVFTSSVTESFRAIHVLLAERLDAAGLLDSGDKWYIPGNHEDRITKYVWRNAKALAGVRGAADDEPILDVGRMLGLGALGVRFATHEISDYPHGSVMLGDNLLVTHGWKALKGAGRSALSVVEQANVSVITGHTHRLAVTSVTRWAGDDTPTVYTAAESGTMADLRGLQYARWPDWQPGFLTVVLHPDGRFLVEPVRWDPTTSTLMWRGSAWQRTATGVRRH